VKESVQDTRLEKIVVQNNQYSVKRDFIVLGMEHYV